MVHRKRNHAFSLFIGDFTHGDFHFCLSLIGLERSHLPTHGPSKFPWGKDYLWVDTASSRRVPPHCSAGCTWCTSDPHSSQTWALQKKGEALPHPRPYRWYEPIHAVVFLMLPCFKYRNTLADSPALYIHQSTLNIPQVLWIPCLQKSEHCRESEPSLFWLLSDLYLSMPHITGQDEESLWSFYYNTRTVVFLFLVQSLRKDTLQWNISQSICDEWCGSLYTDVHTVLVNCNYLPYFEAVAARQRSAKWLLFFREAVNIGF